MAHILIADDEPNIALSLKFLMEKAGHKVSIAEDGEAALACIRDHLPDLVLLDINMPRKNGYEVCEAVRAEPACSGVCIIMLTAKGRDVEREKGLAVGANDYVVKPFATQDVVRKVAQHLQGR